MTSDTPLIDAHQKAMEREDFDVELALTYNFARTIERENAAMREAIKEAHKLASNILRNYECGAEIDSKCEAALAKLQPFIKP